MQEPYSEELAIHTDPESCAWDREVSGEALTGACLGPVLSLEKLRIGVPTPFSKAEGHIERVVIGKTRKDPAWSETWCMSRTTSRENREISVSPVRDGVAGRVGKSKDVIQR